MITLLDIFEGLGKQASILLDEREPIENRRKTAEMAQVTSLVAKNMINIADIALRTEVAATQDKLLKNSNVRKMVSNGYGLVVGNDDETFNTP